MDLSGPGIDIKLKEIKKELKTQKSKLKTQKKTSRFKV